MFSPITPATSPSPSKPSPSTRTLTRSRDNLRRPTGFVLGNEHAVGYGYDVSGRLATLSAQGLPNLPGKSHAFEYTYEVVSNLIDKVTGPVHEVDNTYEPHRDVLLQKTNTRTVGIPGELSVIGYTVNAIGQREQRNLSGEIRAGLYGGQTTDLYATDWGNDALRQVIVHYEYDPFCPSTRFACRFSTKPRDPATGLYYYGYRWFDPYTGRWPSRDPIEESGGVNLYGFVGNASLSAIDLHGKVAWWVYPVVGGIGGPIAHKAGGALGKVGVKPAENFPPETSDSPKLSNDRILRLDVKDCEIMIFIGHGNANDRRLVRRIDFRNPEGCRYRAGAVTCFPASMNAGIPKQNRAYMLPEHDEIMSHEQWDQEIDASASVRANAMKDYYMGVADPKGRPQINPPLPAGHRGNNASVENWNPQAVRNVLSLQAVFQSRRELCEEGCACVKLTVVVEDDRNNNGIDRIPGLDFPLKLGRGETTSINLPACPER